MAIITISRKLGSLGNTIAQAVAEELHYQLLTRESVSTMLVDSGFSESNVMKTFSEEGASSLLENFVLDRDRLICYIKAALYTFARQDNVVIMGMGAQVLFHHMPHTFRLKITAPLDVRLKRIQERYGCDEHYANHLVVASDHARSGFTKYFFNEEWESIHFYDVIVNTERISTAGAVRLITNEVREFDGSDQKILAQNTLADLILQQQILSKILYEEELDFLYMNAVVESGQVTLNGYSRLVDNKQRSEELVRKIPGVRQVVNEIFIEPAAPE